MSSIHALAPNDQAKQQLKPPSTKRRARSNRALELLPFYATHTNAPTLSDVQQASAGVIARLLVAKVRQGVQHG